MHSTTKYTKLFNSKSGLRKYEFGLPFFVKKSMYPNAHHSYLHI